MGAKILAVGAALALCVCCSSASLLVIASKKSTPAPAAPVRAAAAPSPNAAGADAANAIRAAWTADVKTVQKKATNSPESAKTPPKGAKKKGTKETPAPAPPTAPETAAPATPPAAAAGASLGTFGATFYSFRSNGGNSTGAYTSPLAAGRSIAVSNKAAALKPKQTYVMKRGGAASCVSIDDKCSGSGCHDIDIYTGQDHAAALAGGITTVEIFDQRC